MSVIAARLTRLSHEVVLAWGWRRAAIAFVAGAVSVLALAPFNAWPVLFVTFPVAVWLIDGSSAGRLGSVMTASIAGWWFGFGYFVAGPLLARLRVPGRCENLRVAVAVRGPRPAGGARIVHGGGVRPRARVLDARTGAHSCARHRVDRGRMAARPCAHGLSVEHDRLRAHRAAGARAGVRADRTVGPDAVCGRVCSPAPRCSSTSAATRRGRGLSC